MNHLPEPYQEYAGPSLDPDDNYSPQEWFCDHDCPRPNDCLIDGPGKWLPDCPIIQERMAEL
jgi:hypothetical protein